MSVCPADVDDASTLDPASTSDRRFNDASYGTVTAPAKPMTNDNTVSVDMVENFVEENAEVSLYVFWKHVGEKRPMLMSEVERAIRECEYAQEGS